MKQKLILNMEETQVNFLLDHEKYGFKNEEEMIQFALEKLQSELDIKELEASADLYAELYEEDTELQELTETACIDFKEI